MKGKVRVGPSGGRWWGLVLALAAFVLPCSAAAQPQSPPGNPVLRSIIGGVLLHDRGPFSDKLEAGSIDINVEAQFHRPNIGWWGAIGAPYPHIGMNINIGGDTNQLFTGLTWEYYPLRKLAGTFSAGMSLHDGKLEQENKALCKNGGDCGFGSRLIFRFSAGIRYDVTQKVGLEVYYDHISHAKLLDAENEGIDSIGLRVHHRF